MTHFLRFFYDPATGPWYGGQVWGNIVAVSILVPAGFLWSRTKFWPLRPVRRGLAAVHAEVLAHRQEARRHHEELHARVEDLHARHDALEESHRLLHEKLDAQAGAKPVARVARKRVAAKPKPTKEKKP
jgi:hypothetical protein